MQIKHRVALLAPLIPGLLMAPSTAMAAPIPSPTAASPRPADCTLESSIVDLNEGPTDYELNLRPIGDVNVILLFVDFPDEPSMYDTHAIEGLLSTKIEDYYDEASYEQLAVHIDAVHEWYRMPGDAGSYDYSSFEGQWQLFTDAAAAADADVDFSGYDIILTAEGPGGSHPYSPAFIGGSYPVSTNEGPLRWGSTLGQDIYEPSRGYITPVHEMGHLFGLPDLYSFDPGGETHRFVGSWDVMGNIDAKPGFSAWHRNKMGWLADEQVACVGYSGTTEVTLTPLAEPDGTKMAVVKTSDSEAYAIEYRTPDGLDSNLCDEGVLIYRIGADVSSGEGPIELIPAHAPPGGFSCPGDTGGYEPLQTPAFDLGPGEVSTFNDADDDLTVEVLTIDATQATISIDYRGGAQQPLDYTREVVITKVSNKGVIKGRLEAEPGAPGGCAADAPLKVRATNGDVVATGKTKADGSFKIKVKPAKKAKRRYVQAPEKKAGSNFCLEALSDNFRV